jgi:hypothetical protein
MNLLFKALNDHYAAQISEAVATLNIYLNNSVGIGEHSDILAELKKYVDLLDDADGKLATLNKYINNSNSNTQQEQGS